VTETEFKIGVSTEINNYFQNKSSVSSFTSNGLKAVQAEGSRYFIDLAKKAIDIAEADTRQYVDKNEVDIAIAQIQEATVRDKLDEANRKLRSAKVSTALYAAATFLGGTGAASLISVVVTPEVNYYDAFFYGGIAGVVIGAVLAIVAWKKS
jgi:hypothetical protein